MEFPKGCDPRGRSLGRRGHEAAQHADIYF
mgnify:CR=1 FL=1